MRGSLQAKRGLCAALSLLVAVGSTACMGKDGDKQGAPASYAADDASFSLEFSDPPWRVVKQTSRSLRLQVDSEIFGVTLGQAVPPMLLLIASAVSLDEHLKDLLDPAQLSELLEKAGVDKDKIPTNFDTIDTGALASLSNTNLSSFLVGSNATLGTSTAAIDSGGRQKKKTKEPSTSTQAPSEPDGSEDKTSSDEAPTPGAQVPQVPEYLQGVDLKNTRDVAIAELNFLVRENEAQIVDGLQYFVTEQGLSGVTYQLTMSQGIFVRNLYVPTQDYTLRVGIMSLFSLSNEDIHRLFASVSTNAMPALVPDATKKAR